MTRLALVCLAALVAVATASPTFCNKLNCPQFDIVKSFVNDTDFEVRSYKAFKWASVNITGQTKQDWPKVTSEGFDSLFHYIGGGNARKQKVEMAAPVLRQVTAGQGPACSTEFIESFFVPFADQANPVPPSASSSVYIETIAPQSVAVLSFGGYTTEWSTVAAKISAAAELAQKYGLIVDFAHPFVADYDSPFRVFNRHNEIWLPLV